MASENDICISVRGISKKFARSLKRSFVYGAEDIARAVTRRSPNPVLRPSEFWALQDISFDLERGSAIGIIGLNGSGKTTLLRIIAGILRPTKGEVHLQGRVAPMLALGAGFKPSLSGRENIYLNMSILGITAGEINRRYDSVVDFAELHNAIEAPLGTYSTGMQMRLGFACAVHTSPEILIVDEVLSVGDAPFRMKCRNRINELRRAGTSMLLVSHSAVTVEMLTDRCLYLKEGKEAALGPSDEVVKAYEADSISVARAANLKIAAKPDAGNISIAKAAKKTAITGAKLEMPGMSDAGHWRSGEPGSLFISVRTTASEDELSILLVIADLSHGTPQNVQVITSSADVGTMRADGTEATIEVAFAPVTLPPGIYNLKIAITRGKLQDLVDMVEKMRLVVVDGGKTKHCAFYQPREWTFSGVSIENNRKIDDFDEAEGLEAF
jgi:lipopolysaccharide transport system ATP-binding protein